MIDLDLIPEVDKIKLLKSIAEPVREYFHNPVNLEKFQVWLDNQI